MAEQQVGLAVTAVDNGTHTETSIMRIDIEIPLNINIVNLRYTMFHGNETLPSLDFLTDTTFQALSLILVVTVCCCVVLMVYDHERSHQERRRRRDERRKKAKCT